QLGTLGKQFNLPDVHKTLSTAPLTGAANRALAPVSKTGAFKAAAPATGALNGVIGKATDAVSQAGSLGKGVPQRTDTDAQTTQSCGDPLMGNKIVGNVVLPIQITGNALGVLGNAAVDSDSTQTYAHNT